MPNATELKFGDPHNRIAQTDHWTVLLRPRQPTLGALVLVCREEIRAFGDASPAAFADLQRVIRRAEAMLRAVVRYERINYLMLMMVDPDVHFHVIPRYAEPRSLQGVAFTDTGWPGQPALEPAVVLSDDQRDLLRAELAAAWQRAGD